MSVTETLQASMYPIEHNAKFRKDSRHLIEERMNNSLSADAKAQDSRDAASATQRLPSALRE